MRYMLDTNICIFVIKHKPEAVFRNMESIDPRDVCISSITQENISMASSSSSWTSAYSSRTSHTVGLPASVIAAHPLKHLMLGHKLDDVIIDQLVALLVGIHQ